MKIIFTDHAKFKFKIFEQHGLKISESQISDIVRNPVTTNQGNKGRLIIQGQFDEMHLIRVICEIEGETIRIVTFYPARRDRYEDKL